MAEDEVIKHTKKIYKLWFSKEHSIWHKISEFLIEIIIIVFAVTVSIWFHNVSEHKHQQEDVKAFFLGLKEDLINDIKEMNEDKASYIKQKTIFSYISGLKIKEVPSVDTINKYQSWLTNTTEFRPNDGRFQGFKSSGKIGAIENRDLQNDLMDLYEEDIPSVILSNKMYIVIKMKYFDFIFKNQKRTTDTTDNLISLLKTDEAYVICKALSTPTQVIIRYDRCIQLTNKILGEIDEEYH
jgi:Family of unknown function (DUF6090)